MSRYSHQQPSHRYGVCSTACAANVRLNGEFVLRQLWMRHGGGRGEGGAGGGRRVRSHGVIAAGHTRETGDVHQGQLPGHHLEYVLNR